MSDGVHSQQSTVLHADGGESAFLKCIVFVRLGPELERYNPGVPVTQLFYGACGETEAQTNNWPMVTQLFLPPGVQARTGTDTP